MSDETAVDQSEPVRSTTEVDAGDDFSDLARQRREEAEQKAAQPPPDIILGIEQSEVTVVLEPQAVPLRYVDPESLVSLMDSNYAAKLEPPDLGALIRSTSLEAVQNMSQAERLKRAWALQDASIEFKNGKLPTKYGFVPIRRIYIDFEKVFVAVAGITSLAEAVAYEVLELLWRSAGVEKRSEDIRESVRQLAYATRTHSDFGDAARGFLGEAFSQHFAKQFGPKGELLGAFGTRSHRHDFRPSPNIVSNVTLDELHLQVAQFDLDTGSHYAGVLKFSVVAKDDHGTGRLTVASHLPYEEHVKLLGALRDALDGTSAK